MTLYCYKYIDRGLVILFTEEFLWHSQFDNLGAYIHAYIRVFGTANNFVEIHEIVFIVSENEYMKNLDTSN